MNILQIFLTEAILTPDKDIVNAVSSLDQANYSIIRTYLKPESTKYPYYLIGVKSKQFLPNAPSYQELELEEGGGGVYVLMRIETIRECQPSDSVALPLR